MCPSPPLDMDTSTASTPGVSGVRMQVMMRDRIIMKVFHNVSICGQHNVIMESILIDEEEVYVVISVFALSQCQSIL